MDLQAGGLLDHNLDPVTTGDDVLRRYRSLWAELSEPEVIGAHERQRLAARVERLNCLGFDGAELTIATESDSATVRIQAAATLSSYVKEILPSKADEKAV